MVEHIILKINKKIKVMRTKSYKITIYNIKWNDTDYVNDWFEVYGDYESENSIDIESLVEQQIDDCNEDEDRDDLVITHYESKIELDK